MIGCIHKETKESSKFGEGFLSLKELQKFLANKNKDDYYIFLGRFEEDRASILLTL